MMGDRNVFQGLCGEAKELFSLLQKKGPLTKNDLILMTGMKLTSMNRVMQPLEEQKLIVEMGIGESSGGRKPVLYDVNPSRHYAIGIDISRIYTQVVITNLKMKIVFKKQFLMTQAFTPIRTVEAISELIHNALQQLVISKSSVIGVGLGTIGPMNREEGVVLNPRNFSAVSWLNVPIRQMLEQALDLPVLIDNGANTAVLAELLFGCGRDYKNIAYFNCGIGIRTGAIS
ncbi:MAG: ROK family protein, partial [Clostridia bacterium]